MTQPSSTEIVHRAQRLDVSGVQTRAAAAAGEAEFVELEFPFASEEPVERFFGSEQLEVTTRAARLERVGQGVVPLLSNHRSDSVVGRVLSVTIGSDRIARARVRFSRSAAAADVLGDVLDGIRQAVSFGYRVHKMELIESGDDGDRFRVVDWELFEISLVSMPADPTVGTHRSFGADDRRAFRGPLADARRGRRSHSMTISHQQLADLSADEFEQETRNWAEPKRLAAVEARRRIHLETVARNFKAPESLVRRAIERGDSTDDLVRDIRAHRERQYAAEGRGPLQPPPAGLDAERSLGSRDPVFSLDGHDTRYFSLSRALNALAAGRPELAEGEFELSDHLRAADPRREYRGRALTVPLDLLTRAIGKGSPNTTGAALVGVQHMAGAFIDVLRPNLAVGQLGATVIPAQGPDLSIPRQISSASTGWVTEGAGSGESSAEFDSILLTPKTARVRTDITRRMLKQSDPAVDMLIQRDLVEALMVAVDAAALEGAGGAAEPEGLLSISGIGSVAYDATSGATERQSFIDLVDAVASANVRMTSPGFIVSSSVKARLLGRAIDPGSGRFLWDADGTDPEMGRIVGTRAVTSNNVPQALGAGSNEHAIYFGNWGDLIVAQWGTVDLMTDEVTLGDSGGLVIRAFFDVDIAVRRPVSFAIAQVNPAA